MTRCPHLAEERALQAQGFTCIAGIDEAGRGAWAGPVVAAAVVLPLDRPDLAQVLGGVRDSKQCTPRQRDELFDRIRGVALAVSVGSVSPDRVDEMGIVPATQEAMTRAVSHLAVVPSALLVDALRLPDLSLPQTALTKGDVRSLSVAAASIVAKVARDRMMVSLDARYGGYNFARHKGYGTRQHQQALALLGPSPIHRLSFAPLKKLTGATDETVKVLTYNIHHWRGCDDRLDVDRVAKVIAGSKADIVGLNEVFHPLATEGKTRDLLSKMAGQLGMVFAFGRTTAYSDWGYVAGPYGNALLSRYPVRSTQTILLPKTEGHHRRAVLRAELAVGRETWVVCVTHLNHLSESVRAREVAALLGIVAQFGGNLHLLMGDFNTLSPADYVDCPDELKRREAEVLTREDPEGQRELLPLRAVSRILSAGYADAWAAASEGGNGATWPAPSPRVRIDYLFVATSLGGRLVACQVLDDELARTASDHRPVLAEFQQNCVDRTYKI